MYKMFEINWKVTLVEPTEPLMAAQCTTVYLYAIACGIAKRKSKEKKI